MIPTLPVTRHIPYAVFVVTGYACEVRGGDIASPGAAPDINPGAAKRPPGHWKSTCCRSGNPTTQYLTVARNQWMTASARPSVRPFSEAQATHVRGKGGKDRRIPIEQKLIEVLDSYLDSRAVRFPGAMKRRPTAGGLAAWAATAPLFVGSDGERITRGTLQYRVLRLQESRPGRPARPRCTSVWATAHLRHRAGQRRRQRLHVDEVARSRIDDHLAALRQRCRDRKPCCSSTEPAL